MVGVLEILYYLVHPSQARAIVQWKTWHEPPHRRDPQKEAPSLRECFKYLDLTSRSFSSVIQELHPELLVPITLFYLVLRALDTVEDDMTISIEKKEPILRNFHNLIEQEGWKFDGNGPEEKDRELLVHFDVVNEELKKIKRPYQVIIKSICREMGNGMADYCVKHAQNVNDVETIKDYDLYCHYVAGILGDGLTQMFIESGLANKALADRPNLHNSMGLFLQKTNIIRDIKEDVDDHRIFWPREIWSKYVDSFDDLVNPKNINIALNCSSEMVLNSLSHADEVLFYLAGLKEQSVFNFAAIPQCMAIATLELVFRNPEVFRKNIKITKGDACRIMTKSTQNLRMVCEVFRTYVRRIHKKNDPRDPNFLKISIACGKVEQFIESIFPSQDPKAVLRQQTQERVLGTEDEEREAAEARKDLMYMLAGVVGLLFFISLIMLGLAYAFGAKFGLTADEVKDARDKLINKIPIKSIKQANGHGEL